MKTQKLLAIVTVMIITAVAITGCGKGGGGVDENKPLSQIKAEIEKLDVEQIKKTAMKYKDTIMDKQGDIDDILAKIKDIPLTEALGKQAKELKNEMTNLKDSLSALKERFNLYYDKAKELKADVSELAI
jgi:chromosome segregation ATPase